MMYLYVLGIMIRLNVTLASLLNMWEKNKNIVLDLIRYTVQDLDITVKHLFLHTTYIGDNIFVAEFLGKARSKYIEIILIYSDNPIKALETFYRAKSLGLVEYQEDNSKRKS
jgi:hypothetical protein